MNRSNYIKEIANSAKIWDMVVIGGGATGLGTAVDAATRGYSVALFEAEDFAKGTSSRSTKLVHGGVRYLAQGDIGLVLEALHERGLLKKNAPHLVKDQAFLIPNYSYWDNFLYTIGLNVYDLMAGTLSFGRSKYYSPSKTLSKLPTIKAEGLKGGVLYHDGQFDDSRLAVNLAQTCADHGGCPMNHIQVTAILHHATGEVAGVRVRDLLYDKEYEVKARCVINAGGIFVDHIMQLDNPSHKHMVRPSQGIHLVFDKSFLQSDYALMIPKTDDGRVLFAVPWHNKVVVGTTDTLRNTPEKEPQALEEEIERSEERRVGKECGS